jgi:U1 small nuclear ribonucleoprotein
MALGCPISLNNTTLCCAVQGDPYKTLFVSRLSYEVTERKLRHEFEEFGPIKRIRLVHDQDKGERV